MFAHQFQYKILAAQISHFIKMFNLKVDDALQTRLPDAQNFAAADVLTQEHTKCRSSDRGGFVDRSQIDKRKACTCGEQKPCLSGRAFTGQQDFICFRLCDLCDPGA